MHQRVVAATIARDVPLQSAELFGERDLLILVELLVAEAQHMVADKRVVDGLAGRRVQLLRQIETNHLRTQHR